MKKFQLLVIVALILLLVLVGSVQAQDATEEPTNDATEAVTITPDGTVVEPLSDSEKVTFSWTVVSQVMLAVIVSFMAGGLTVGGGILLALRTILKNPLLSNMVEKLFLSQPPERRERERGIIEGIKEIATGVDKLTDGVLEPEGTALG